MVDEAFSDEVEEFDPVLEPEPEPEPETESELRPENDPEPDPDRELDMELVPELEVVPELNPEPANSEDVLSAAKAVPTTAPAVPLPELSLVAELSAVKAIAASFPAILDSTTSGLTLISTAPTVLSRLWENPSTPAL